MNLLLLLQFIMFTISKGSEKSIPHDLKKEEPKGFVEKHYSTILSILLIILLVLIILMVMSGFYLLVVHGQNITGTEACNWYNGDLA